MKKIQRLTSPTGECLRVFDRYDQPFLLMSQSKHERDQIQAFKVGGLWGIAIGLFISGVMINVSKSFQGSAEPYPINHQSESQDGIPQEFIWTEIKTGN